MEYGYVRNSVNNEKSIEKQKEELLKYAKEQNVVVDDTGEQFRAMLAKMQNGDSVHVTHTDRITKNPEVFAYSAKTEHSLRMSGALFRGNGSLPCWLIK